MKKRCKWFRLLALGAFLPGAAAAQTRIAGNALGTAPSLDGARLSGGGRRSADTTCTYERCALGISPVWNGLALVRGSAQTRVGVLGFFLPRDVRRVFAGSDSAQAFATRALHVRRLAAALTDLGGLMLIGGGAMAIRDKHLSRGSNALGMIGAGLLTFSVPAQFIADGHLSKAVWWYNLQFAKQ